jgi:topoisomerase-4 subunit A
MAQLESLMQEHFVDYASYFVLDRAIPELRDGLKPVQRRILHTLFRMNDGRYHKVANVIGETMKLHPHGDASIADALVVLANKEFFIDRQGNFGNPVTGHPAAAARYIECRLTPLAIETLFNEALTEFVPSYDGRSSEPVVLPVKLPVLLMLGCEGIAVGMSTRILPHNLLELWQAQISLLKDEPIALYPDFLTGGVMDASAYDDGHGKVEVRAVIEAKGEKKIVIREIPHGTTTESLIASIESATQKGRVQIAGIDDFTTEAVEIELSLPRGVHAPDVIPQLYAYTDCSVSVSANPTVIHGRKPVMMGVREVLEELTRKLREQLKLELEQQRGQLVDRQHWLTLEQIFIEEKVYRLLEEAKTEKAVVASVWSGMEPFADQMIRAMEDEDVTRLLQLRIRRISAYDLQKSRDEVGELAKQIKAIDKKLKKLTQTTISYIEDLIEKYGDAYPRRTKMAAIEAVDKKSVARQTIKLSYDKETGFFGSAVRGDEFKLSVSEFGLVLGIASDGSYRVMPPLEKVFFAGKLIYCEPFDPDQGVEFVAVYRDNMKIAYAKRFKIEKFIRNKEYQLIKGEKGKLDLLIPPESAGVVALTFKPAPRQRVKGGKFDLGELELTSPTSRGRRLAPKPVSKLAHERRKPGAKKAAPPKPAEPAEQLSLDGK